MDSVCFVSADELKCNKEASSGSRNVDLDSCILVETPARHYISIQSCIKYKSVKLLGNSSKSMIWVCQNASGPYLHIRRKNPSRWALRSTSPLAALMVFMNWWTQIDASAAR